MKKKMITTFTIFGLIFFNLFTQTTAKSIPVTDPAIAMLKSFYTEYITESSKVNEDWTKINLLLNKSCTKKLLKELKDPDLDYDLFLSAQDVSMDWLKNFTIKKDYKTPNMYIVRFFLSNIKETKIIKLTVIQQNGIYKIDTVTGVQ